MAQDRQGDYRSRVPSYDTERGSGRSRTFSERESVHRESDEVETNQLWVGNVTSEYTEQILREIFGRYGPVESVAIIASRSYAFIGFKDVRDATEAKKGLHGVVVRGRLPFQVEFAKTSRPSRYVFVGGISPSLSRQKLESEFQRYGRIEDFRINREKSCAHVDFAQQSDAIAAVEGLNGKVLGNEVLRVEYGRHPYKRETTRAAESLPRDEAREIGASDVLWIGHPLYLKVTEASLRKEFGNHGKISRVKTYPGRTYSYVQFVSTDDAIRAKQAMDGKLFNDDRVKINFTRKPGVFETSRSGYHDDVRGREDEHGAVDHGQRGGRWERSYEERTDRYDDRTERKEYQSGWTGRENEDMYLGAEKERMQPFQETKRPPLGYDERLDREGPPMDLGKGYADDPRDYDRRLASTASNVNRESGPVSSDPSSGPWMGALAKGGTFVCRARAFRVGQGIDNPLPEVINCTARTDLDVLGKHIVSAPGFGIIALVPVDDPDIPPYEDFVAYLGDKRRAGVAKCADGSTLFLVPPSDFSQDVLRIPQRDALFGVVLLSQPRQSSDIKPPLPAPAPVSKLQLETAPQPVAVAPPPLPLGLSPEVLASLSSFLPQVQSSGPHHVSQSTAPLSGGFAPVHSAPRPVAAQNHQFSSSYAAPHLTPPYTSSVSQPQPPGQVRNVSAPVSGPPSGHPQPLRSQTAADNQGQGQPFVPVPHLPPDQLSQLTALLAQSKAQEKSQAVSAVSAGTTPAVSGWASNLGQQQVAYGGAQSHTTVQPPQSSQPLSWEAPKSEVHPAVVSSSSYNTSSLPQNVNPPTTAHQQPQAESDSARFQATLQLAAALLQQMQKQPQGNAP